MLDLLLPAPKAAPQQITTGGDYGWEGDGISWGQKTRAGVVLDNEISLTYGAVLCATRLLAEGVGGLPKPLYHRVSHDERQLADLPVANVVKFPNPLMTATPFWESRTAHQVNWDGGGFAEIEFYGKTDRVKWLWPIHPSRVRRSRNPDFDYEVRNNDGSYVSLYSWEMLHIPGIFPADGIWSKGTLSYGREIIGGAIGVDRASYSFLGSGGQPKGIVQSMAMGGQDKRSVREAFRKEWETVHGNPELHVPTIAILGGNDKYTPLEILGNEANQIVQSRTVNKTDIPTLYNVPAYRIPGCESKETAGTVEQRAIDFVVSSLMPWIRKQEEQCNFKLLPLDKQLEFYFQYNVSGLLRGDTAARYNAYRIAFSIGLMCVNDMRRLEDLPNVGPAGDLFFRPANMVPLDYVGPPGGTTGSDQNGQPADNPMDRQAALDREHFGWLKSLGTIRGQETQKAFKALEYELPERPVDYREGARVALTDVFGRMLKRESNAAQSVMSGKKDFDAWLREFYHDYEAFAASALESACWNLRAAGIKKWGEPAELAAWLRARNVEALQRCYNGDTPETAARRLRAWPTDRAKELTDEIMGDNATVPTRIKEEPSSLDTALELLAKAQAKHLESPAPVVNVHPVINVNLPPKTNDTIERDADGRVSGVKRVPIGEGGNAKSKAK